MKKIWQKSASEKTNEYLIKLVEKFTVGNDHTLDQELVPYDLQGSKAHAKGLAKIGIISSSELKILINALNEIQKKWEMGDFIVKQEQEDCHTAIEQELIKITGDLGKKIHTGRSRNDQVLVTTRLYSREKINQIIENSAKLTQSFLNFAKKHEFVPMPGYTHTQRAMPCSIGMWSGSFAEMILMNLEMIKAVQKNVNLCPLGSATGFGVEIDLPREFVAKELGFNSPLIISLTSQNSRGKIEADILSALTSLGSTLAHFSNDVVWFMSQEFNYFNLPDELTTGSSIMPQKKNPDPAELIRARYSQLFGFECQLRDLTKGLISGYHRDLQLSKEPLMKGFDSILEMIEMSSAIINNLEPIESNLRKNFSVEIFAADLANKLVKEGKTFRDAYIEVGNNLKSMKMVDIDKNIREKTHLGATGNLGLDILEKKLSAYL